MRIKGHTIQMEDSLEVSWRKNQLKVEYEEGREILVFFTSIGK